MMVLRRKTWGRIFIALGCSGLIVSACFAYSTHRSSPLPTAASSPAVAERRLKQPVQAAYTVPPLHPKTIEIPAAGVKAAQIVKLGTQKNNQIAAPGNTQQVGWYQGSRPPGEDGVMFLYGHVSDWKNDGVFSNVKNLKPGDVVRVTRGDEKTFTYRVVSTKTYETHDVDMQEILTPVGSAAQSLSLMTCAGKYDHRTKEFSQRLVVFAVPV
jgi:LPXTG-site transpeptidase (sortase) family protein